MAKVLKEEDFAEGKEPEDTSKPSPKPDEVIEAKEKPEPEKEPEPSDKGEAEPLPKPSEDKKYKHSTWEETEKARIEAERRMHEATTKASELERRVSQYEKPPEKVVTIDDKIREMTKDTLAKIKTLPADSPNRDEEAGYLWAKLQSNLSDINYEERQKKVDTERKVVTRTYERATKEGIKTDAELGILGYEFSKTDLSLSTDDRISQAIDSTKNVLSQIREGLVEKQEQDKKEKDDLKVLGRGSSRPGKSDEVDKKPMSMSQQLAELNEKRRLKKDELR